MWKYVLAMVAGGLLAVKGAESGEPEGRPNVLLIAVDDLNDWVGAFGGNPQGITPALDRFAEQGAVVFQRAYCPGPVCGPSRSAMLSGFWPHRTGIYNNDQNMLRSALVQEHATLPEYFAQQGYATVSRGKIFHAHAGSSPGTTDQGQWAFAEWHPATGSDRVDPRQLTSRGKGLILGAPEPGAEFRKVSGTGFDWGPVMGDEEEMKDTRTARWAAQRLQELPAGQPFFLAVGISNPHLPWFVPQRFFDLHPLDTIRIPEFRREDLEDIVDGEGRPREEPSADFEWVNRDAMLFKRAVQAYLAASSYADWCVGVILDGLAASPHADNTVVVILGDHGWHLGEKLRFRKATLWAEATRLPLMVRVPGRKERADCARVVNLIDLYPTLADLAGLPMKGKDRWDGRSLKALLEEPEAAWEYPTLVDHPGGKGIAVIGERFYYIQRGDGGEEFYDMEQDPLQWRNLAGSKEKHVRAEMARLKALVPDQRAKPIAAGEGKAKAGNSGDSGVARRDLSRLK